MCHSCQLMRSEDIILFCTWFIGLPNLDAIWILEDLVVILSPVVWWEEAKAAARTQIWLAYCSWNNSWSNIDLRKCFVHTVFCVCALNHQSVCVQCLWAKRHTHRWRFFRFSTRTNACWSRPMMAFVSDHAESDSATSDTLSSLVIRGRAARRRNCTCAIIFLWRRAMKRSNHWPKIEEFKWFNYLGTLGMNEESNLSHELWQAIRNFYFSNYLLFMLPREHRSGPEDRQVWSALIECNAWKIPWNISNVL